MMLGIYDAGSQENGQTKMEERNFGDARQSASAGAGPGHSHRRTSIGHAYRLLGSIPSPIP